MSEEDVNVMLNALFKSYRIEPAKQFTISDVCRNRGLDVSQVRTFLSDRGLIRDVISIGSDVFCRITINGIEQIDNIWLSSRSLDVIEALGSRGGRGDLMDILELPAIQHSMMLDVVKYLDGLGFARLEHSVVDINLFAELTAEGHREFENRPNFFE